MKSNKLTLAIAIILLALYNVIMFVFPFAKTDVFWTAYIFTTISILVAMSVFLIELGKGTLKSKFYSLSLGLIAWSYFLLQVIAGFIEIAYFLPAWAALIINSVLLSFCLIWLFSADLGKEHIEQFDEKVEAKRFFIKILQGEIESLKNKDLQKEIKALSELVAYSDPMSHSKLITIENKIESKIGELKELIANTELAKPLFTEIEDLFTERNRLTRLYKNEPEPQIQEKQPITYTKIIIVVASIAVAIGIVLAINTALIQPTKIKQEKYAEATELYNNGEFISAYNIYKELGDYKDSKTKQAQIISGISKGETISFGYFNNKPLQWTILDKQEDKLLLICISDDNEFEKPFNEELKNITWENSSICKWLNKDFLADFSKEDKAKIVENNDSDKAFLLSIEEYKNYSETSNLKTIKEWWLRTNAEDNAKAMFVSGVNIEPQEELVTKFKLARPCVWISI